MSLLNMLKSGVTQKELLKNMSKPQRKITRDILQVIEKKMVEEVRK